MNFKYILLVFALIILIFGTYLNHTGFFISGVSLKSFAYYIFPIAFFSFFATKKSIDTLRIFSLVYIPVSLMIIYLQPPTGDIWDLSEPGMGIMSIWLGTIYLITGLLILLFNSKKTKGEF